MRNFNYIILEDLTKPNARSIQVTKTSEALSHELGNYFKLFCINSNSRFAKILKQQYSNKILDSFNYLSQLITLKLVGVIYSRNFHILCALKTLGVGDTHIFEVHDSIKGLNGILFKIFKSKMKYVCISEALRNYLLNQGVKSTHVTVCHDAVDPEPYLKINESKNQLRSQLKLPKDKFIVLHSGSIFYGRGSEYFKIFLEDKRIQFISIGGSEEECFNLRKRYQNKKIIIVPRINNQNTLAKYQKCADALFLPMNKKSEIWWCSSPMKLFEYLITGNLILHSGIGAINEVLNPNNSIKINLEESLNLDVILDKKKELDLKRNIQLVLNNYTWDIRAKSISEFAFNN